MKKWGAKVRSYLRIAVGLGSGKTLRLKMREDEEDVEFVDKKTSLGEKSEKKCGKIYQTLQFLVFAETLA